MLSLNDIKIIFYGPYFATKALFPPPKKKKNPAVLGSFFLICYFNQNYAKGPRSSC